MPDALERKYPRAAWEWAWQWAFPARRSYTDPRSGRRRRHHLHEWAVQRAFKDVVRVAGVCKPATCYRLFVLDTKCWADCRHNERKEAR